MKFQKQPPEVFCEKRCSLKFFKTHRKTSKACNFIKKETLAQVFSCEFREIFKNIFFTEHLWVTTSGISGVPINSVSKSMPKKSMLKAFRKKMLRETLNLERIPKIHWVSFLLQLVCMF